MTLLYSVGIKMKASHPFFPLRTSFMSTESAVIQAPTLGRVLLKSLMLCGCYLEIHDHLSLNLCFVSQVFWGSRSPLSLPLPSDQDLLGDGGGLGVGARRSDWSSQGHAPWGIHRQGKEAEFSHLAGSRQAFSWLHGSGEPPTFLYPGAWRFWA